MDGASVLLRPSFPSEARSDVRVVSVCSGAGGMDLGFHRAGFTTVALCEYEPWLRDLLALRFPGVPCWPDLRTLNPAELPAADVLIGGTPCQDLSITGRRAGLDGAKSGLFWDFCRIRNAAGVEWAVWENVAGALSSNDGVDFACVLGAFVGADVPVPRGGWTGFGVVTGPWGGAVWRVLDAQWFGVPQRRRRVFVVGRLGGTCPPEVLLEPAGSGWNPPPSRQPREDDPVTFGVGVAGTLGALTGGSRTTDLDGHGAYVGAPVLLREPTGGAARGAGCPVDDDRGRKAGAGLRRGEDRDARASANADGVGAPDGLAGRVDGAMSAFDPRPDNRRFSACGNGVAAPVAEWIGRRLSVELTSEED